MNQKTLSFSMWIQKLQVYFIASRPWSFTASLTGVLLGSALAWKFQGQFNFILYLASTVVVLAVHGAGNLVNTYYDFVNQFDTDKSDDVTLVKGLMTPTETARCIASFYVVGVMAFLITLALSPVKNEQLLTGLFALGVLSSFLYTGGLGLKYIALGDVLIFLTFGPLTSLFAYVVMTGEISLWVPVYAVPLAVSTEAILHGNNTRDLENDRNAGAVTLATILGKHYACVFYSFLLLFPYLVLVIVAVVYSSYLMLPLITIPAALRLKKDCYEGRLDTIPQRTAQMNLAFGVLFVGTNMAASSFLFGVSNKFHTLILA